MTPDGASPAEGRILVCVGASPTSARLIWAAHRLAQGLGVGWLAVTVEAPDAYAMDREDRARRDAHLRLAESLGGEVARLAGRHVSDEIIRCARERGVHALSRDMIAMLDASGAAGIIARHAVNQFGGESAVYLLDGESLSPCGAELRPPLATEQEALVRWVCQQRQAAGRGTLLQPEQPITCLPLATARCLGVLVLRRREGFDSDLGRFLEAFVRQASLALDRARLSEEARSAVLRARSEEMRGVLLSMASHDLRTPLAAITGAGTALRDEAGLSAGQRLELVETLCIEAERMERLVSNLLEMVRLESGGCHLHSEWVPFEELAGSALSRLERRCQGREVRVTVDESIPMLYVDPVIFEQVLINLLDNALKYTPEGTPLDWRVTGSEGRVTLLFHDRGPGLPAGEEERLFDKFTRGRSGGIPGSGLGLAICRGIVQAHGGTIQAANREGGGAVFRIDLPQCPLPPECLLEEDVHG